MHGIVVLFFVSQHHRCGCILPAIVGRFVAEDDKWSNLILSLMRLIIWHC